MQLASSWEFVNGGQESTWQGRGVDLDASGDPGTATDTQPVAENGMQFAQPWEYVGYAPAADAVPQAKGDSLEETLNALDAAASMTEIVGLLIRHFEARLYSAVLFGDSFGTVFVLGASAQIPPACVMLRVDSSQLSLFGPRDQAGARVSDGPRTAGDFLVGDYVPLIGGRTAFGPVTSRGTPVAWLAVDVGDAAWTDAGLEELTKLCERASAAYARISEAPRS